MTRARCVLCTCAGACACATNLSEFVDVDEGVLDAHDALVDLVRVGREFVAQSERRGVLEVRPADLDHVGELGGLVGERVAQGGEVGQQQVVDLHGRRDVHGRGEGVVGRLAHVDVVVGVHGRLAAQLPAQQLDRAVGDDLVHVHVGLRARARLPHHQREVIVQLSTDHLCCVCRVVSCVWRIASCRVSHV